MCSLRGQVAADAIVFGMQNRAGHTFICVPVVHNQEFDATNGASPSLASHDGSIANRPFRVFRKHVASVCALRYVENFIFALGKRVRFTEEHDVHPLHRIDLPTVAIQFRRPFQKDSP